MKRFSSIFALALGLGMLTPVKSQAVPPQNGPVNCGNSTNAPTGNEQVPAGPPCGPVNAYTGDMTQTNPDITANGGVGESPLTWTRLEHTRTTPGNSWFGDTAIRHSYQWEIADAGVDSSGRAILTINDPEGDVYNFTQTSGSVWTPLVNVSDRLTESGSDYYLQKLGGDVYHFQRLVDGNGAAYYQMQDFKDTAQNDYTFTYDPSNPNHLTKVTEPGGRSLQITWGTVPVNGATLLGAITAVPPDSTWSQLTVANSANFRYLWYQSAANGWCDIAELQFLDASGTSIAGTPFGTPGSYNNHPGNVYTSAFDGNTSTFFDAPMASGAIVGIDAGASGTSSVASISYYPRIGWAARMYTSNPNTTGRFYGSGNPPQEQEVITSVSSYNPQGTVIDTVNYNYTTINDSTFPDVSYAVLSSVNYDDGTTATLNYTQYFAGTRPLLSSYSEPRLVGGLPQLKVLYNTRSAGVLGYVWQQQNPATSAPILTLGAEGGETHNVFLYYSNGGVDDYNTADGFTQINFYKNSLGNHMSWTYDSGGNGLISGKIDQLGRKTTYTRNANAGILTQTNPDGGVETWTRDSLNLPLTFKDENGNTTTYTRDANHRTTQITYPDSSTESFTYNSFGQILTHTLRNGGTESNTYDATGLKLTHTDPLGNTTTYAYDSADRLNSVTDANGHATTMTYNPRGLVTQITNPDSSAQTFTYDQYGNKLTSTDELGHTTTMTYDWFNRLVTATDPLNRTTTTSYALPGSNGCACNHSENNPTQITLPSGKITTFTYDTEWQKLSQTTGAGTADAATTQWTYDADGEVTAMTDPNSHLWSMAYDNRGRKTSQTDPLSNVTKWTYDAVGNVLTTTRPDNGVTTNTYDAMNRLLTSADPKSETTIYAYDNADNLTALTDAKGNAYHFTYDLLNRKLSMTYPDSSKEQWAYDPVGNLSSYTARAAQVESFTYDNRNRLTAGSWSDGTPAVSYSYDAAGNLLTQSSSVSALSYAYDNANEMTGETQSIAALGTPLTISYGYDADGNRSSATYPDGTALNYSYTNRNQLSGISDNDGSVVGYTYDANGNRVSKALANSTSSAYTYDADNRLLTLNHTLASGSLNYAYTLNNVGDRTSRSESLASGTTTDNYSYDAIDQVTGVAYGSGRNVGYAYDPVGNRTSLTDSTSGTTSYTTNNLNQYTAIASQVSVYDNNGNLTNLNGWTYAYDAQNRLLSARNGTTTETFAYDPQNRCVSRTLNGATTNFLYDGWQLVEELDGPGSEQALYVSGANVDEILYKATSANTVFYQHDALGNTTALSDASGNLVEHYTYDVFGKPSFFDASNNPLTASAYGNRFLFTGREYLSEIALYDYRNRVYSADLGRFLQTDPLRFAAGDVNVYRYVRNNAVNLNDPLGLFKVYKQGKKIVETIKNIKDVIDFITDLKECYNKIKDLKGSDFSGTYNTFSNFDKWNEEAVNTEVTLNQAQLDFLNDIEGSQSEQIADWTQQAYMTIEQYAKVIDKHMNDIKGMMNVGKTVCACAKLPKEATSARAAILVLAF